MTAEELKRLRAKRIAQKVQAAYGYNPQVSKPKTLDPTMEAGRAFHFWGPLPDAGFSYGAFECSNCKTRSVLTAGVEQYCPACGTTMDEPVREVPVETVQQAVATASFGDLFNVCPTCEKHIVTTIDTSIAKALGSVFCTQCGTEMPKAAEALKVVAQYSDDESEENTDSLPSDPEGSESEEGKPSDDASAPEGEPVSAPITEPVASLDSGEEPAPEPAAPVPEPAAPVPEGEENKEEKPEQESETEGASVDNMETLANLKDLEGVKADEVEMVLFAVNSDNPHWDVYMKGNPVARISLKDVPRSEEIKARFIDAKAFPNDIAVGIEKLGYRDILTAMNAKFFAYNMDKSESAERIREQVKAELEQEHKTKLVTLKDNLLKAIKVAAQAANVNFFKGTDNTLRETLFNQMDKAGVADPMSIIANAFDAGQVPYINGLLNKAVELMSMAPEAYSQIEKAIAEVNPNSIKNSSVATAGMSMKQKLANGNVPIIATTGSFEAPNSPEVSSPSNYAQNLKSRIRLSARGF